jgi:hypothetical protein
MVITKYKLLLLFRSLRDHTIHQNEESDLAVQQQDCVNSHGRQF